jgi:anti-anti-sigma factor
LDDRIVLELRGELDLATVPIVQEELGRAKRFYELVVLDLRQVSFMDSAGLQLLVSMQKRMRDRGGSLLVVQGQRQVQRLFELTGIVDQLQLIDDPAAVPGLSL